jgi:hypothetical protein
VAPARREGTSSFGRYVTPEEGRAGRIALIYLCSKVTLGDASWAALIFELSGRMDGPIARWY